MCKLFVQTYENPALLNIVLDDFAADVNETPWGYLELTFYSETFDKHMFFEAMKKLSDRELYVTVLGIRVPAMQYSPSDFTYYVPEGKIERMDLEMYSNYKHQYCGELTPMETMYF